MAGTTGQRKDIVIVGGSLAGLMQAIVFKTLGHNVHVLEKSPPEVLQSQASGLGAMPEVRQFIDEYISDRRPYATTLETIEFMNKQGELVNRFPPADPYYLTAWAILHRMFKSALMQLEDGPGAIYQTNARVQNVHVSERVKLEYLDLSTGEERVVEAHTVIAADGAHSTIRKVMCPDVIPQYAGYVTWRGAVSENAVPEPTRKLLHNRAIMSRTEDGGFIMSYYVPAESGSQGPGECQFIWVWYQKVPDEKELEEDLTDVEGRKHLTTIPRGRMRDEIWAKTLDRGKLLLGPPFIDLLENTRDPFFSAIRHFKSLSPVLADGKVLLVGDAFTLFRPHGAASTNQAARQALGMAKVFRGEQSLEEWQKESLAYASKFTAISDAFGEYCFTGVVPPLLQAVIPSETKPTH